MTTTTDSKIDKARAELKKYPKARRWLRRNFTAYGDAYIEMTVADALPTGHENVDLMQKTLAYARKEQRRPMHRRRFYMGHWFVGSVKAGEEPSCGTQACLAGTAVHLSLKPGWSLIDGMLYTSKGKRSSTFLDVGEEGRRRLGLNDDQAMLLFYATSAKVAELTELASIVVGKDLRP